MSGPLVAGDGDVEASEALEWRAGLSTGRPDGIPMGPGIDLLCRKFNRNFIRHRRETPFLHSYRQFRPRVKFSFIGDGEHVCSSETFMYMVIYCPSPTQLIFVLLLHPTSYWRGDLKSEVGILTGFSRVFGFDTCIHKLLSRLEKCISVTWHWLETRGRGGSHCYVYMKAIT